MAGDDEAAVRLVAGLVRDAGFDPVVVGPLARAKDFDVGTPMYAYRDPADAYWYRGQQPGDMFAVFYGVQLSPGPEQWSVLTPVIKKVAVLNQQQFTADYCGGNAPAQPVNDMVVDYDPPPGELIGGDEGCGDMPDLRGHTP